MLPPFPEATKWQVFFQNPANWVQVIYDFFTFLSVVFSAVNLLIIVLIRRGQARFDRTNRVPDTRIQYALEAFNLIQSTPEATQAGKKVDDMGALAPIILADLAPLLEALAGALVKHLPAMIGHLETRAASGGNADIVKTLEEIATNAV